MAEIENALQCYHRGLWQQAALICKDLIGGEPENADAIHLAGMCQWQLGERYLGVELLRRALALKRDDATLLYNLGCMELDLGEFRNAAERFMGALSILPDAAEYHYKFGVACERIEQTVEAERAYLRALQFNPNCAPAYGELSALLERGNRLDEAGRAAAKALELNPSNETARIVDAMLVLRRGDVELATDKFRTLLSGPLAPANKAIVMKRLAACLDRQGKYDEAFRLIATSNELTENNGEVSGPGWCTLEAVGLVRDHSTALLDAADNSEVPGDRGGRRTIFLVGFPRSGTTLLDQMLDAHDKLKVIEEKTTLRAVLADAFAKPEGLSNINDCDQAGLNKYREAYWREVDRWLPDLKDDELVIDKLPLNTMYMPLIHRLFPAARFIFALRDPRDSVFSCFMSSFGMNESMRHFVSLRTAADYYAAVMGIAVESFPRLEDQIHVQRYEDLILQPEEEQKALCAFLGVEWEKTMLEVQKNTRGKRINTPSYHQVTQPLYRRAVGRWRNYREQMTDILPVLEPFVRRWGYEPD